MENHQKQLDRLVRRLEGLEQRQSGFDREIKYLRWEINQLQNTIEASPEREKPAARPPTIVRPPYAERELVPATPVPPEPRTAEQPLAELVKTSGKLRKPSLDLEKFIGENLISKVGIAMTVIGVAIGVKYSIDNNLLNPLTRIILGYVAGLALLATGIRLKRKYESYSAILVSGAMTVLYFVTYTAYGMYDLLPQTVAFFLMVIFTIFTVLAALTYDRQVIALIGLVGAYAVPFLLSNDSGSAGILFTYMTIINVGILVIAFRKYWKPLYHTAFGLTWFIYTSWLAVSYSTEEYFSTALVFLTVFFVLFYLTFLAYKLVRREQFGQWDILLLLGNSFLFYGCGYLLLDGHPTGRQLLGVFTLVNAVVHFGVAMTIKRRQLADKKLLYLVAGLVLVFVTITIPVQLDGNWVTMLWTGEAVLLFWIARKRGIIIYENLAYPLMVLAFLSIVHDWNIAYGSQFFAEEVDFKPVFNIHFLGSLFFIAAFGYLTYLSRTKTSLPKGNLQVEIAGIMRTAIPVVLVFALYNAFRLEIVHYWDVRYVTSLVEVSDSVDLDFRQYNTDLREFKTVWVINYTLLFLSMLSLFNIERLKSRTLGWINLGLNVLALFGFLSVGLYVLSELRESYLDQALAEHYEIGIFYLAIRYVAYLFVGLLLWVTYQYQKRPFMQTKLRVVFNVLLHISLLWILSSELLHWMDIAGSAQVYKLGLSILWGTYALLLIMLGIWKNQQYLRIGAIILFVITLVKLFVYDITHLPTIAKTIVFLALGVLLLIISFLYNKYKHLIIDEKDS